MKGTNPVAKFVRDESFNNRYQVVEGGIFHTIQGEGPFSGHPSVFIRLTGCPYRCAFCDTVWDDKLDPYLELDEIISEVKQKAGLNTELVVITGGEPTRWPLGPLILALRNARFVVQIETAGVWYREGIEMAQIVVSPKTSRVDPQIANLAIAWKYPLEYRNMDPADGLPLYVLHGPERQIHSPARPPEDVDRRQVFITPIDSFDEKINAANRQHVAKVALEHGYTAQVQLHKFLNVE